MTPILGEMNRPSYKQHFYFTFSDGEFQAIQGKKVKGIGFGNIFAQGPVKLKGAKKQESGENSTDHANPAPQEAKVRPVTDLRSSSLSFAG